MKPRKRTPWEKNVQNLREKYRSSKNSHYFVIGKWLVLLGMLYLMTKFINLKFDLATFSQLSIPTLVGYLGLNLLSKFFYAFRWHLICSQGLGLHGTSNLSLLRINLIAEFVGISMPTSLGGEAVRVMKLTALTKMGVQSATSIVADRLMGLFSMLLIVFALLPTLGASTVWRPPLPASSLSIIMVLIIAILGMGFLWLRRLDRTKQLLREIQQLEFGFPLLITSVLISVIGHLIFATGYYLLFQEFEPLSFLVAISVTLTAQLARSVPISLLGLGLGDPSMVALTSLVGIATPAGALSVIIIALGFRYIFAIFGLLLELTFDGKIFLKKIIKRKTLAGDS